MVYEFVQMIEGSMIRSEVTADNLFAWCAVRSIEHTGFCRRRGLRPELIGQPTFRAYAGPCYGGPGIVRYEDREVNNELSS